jgi:hypothetical protein
MSKTEHIALAQYFIYSPVTLLIPITIWGMYMFKIFRFNRQVVGYEENRFLQAFELMKRSSRYKNLFLIILNQSFPATFYGFFLSVIALENNAWTTFATIWLAQLVLFAISCTLLSNLLTRINVERKAAHIRNFLNEKFTKPLFVIYSEWTMERQPFIVLGSKFFACALLFGVLQLYKIEPYDLRLLAMAVVFTAFGATSVIQGIQQFENEQFQVMRNLPLQLWNRLVPVLVLIIFFSIPEIVIITKYFPAHFNFADWLQVNFYIISIQVLIYGLRYTFIKFENFNRMIFVLSILSFGAVLFKVPVGVLAMMSCLAGLYLYQKNYYRYEPSAS